MRNYEYLFDAWHQWFFDRWGRGDGMWLGGYAIDHYVRFVDHDGFGGEW